MLNVNSIFFRLERIKVYGIDGFVKSLICLFLKCIIYVTHENTDYHSNTKYSDRNVKMNLKLSSISLTRVLKQIRFRTLSGIRE